MLRTVVFDEGLLFKAGCSSSVVKHSMAVERLATSLAARLPFSIDMEVVRLGALFHDIGRGRSHGIDHAVIGVDIGRAFGLPGPVLMIIERHIGAGITAAEAERLGLPKKDYIPLTPEEKIVSYADNLIIGTEKIGYHRALERFRNMLGPDHEGVKMFIKQHDEIMSWLGDK